MEQSCRNTHIAMLQYRYKDLAAKAISMAEIGSSEYPCMMKRMIIVSKYIDMLYCYKGLDAALTYSYRFDVASLEESTVHSIKSAIELSGTYLTIYDRTQAYLYVYSYNAVANHSEVLGYIASITSEVLNCSNVINNPEYLLDVWNCITLSELCGIIDHAYILTES